MYCSSEQAVREAATICPAPCDLDLSPFDPESGVRVTCDVGYLPTLVFLGLSVLDLGPMYATDRQTSDAHQRLMARGGGIINFSEFKHGCAPPKPNKKSIAATPGSAGHYSTHLSTRMPARITLATLRKRGLLSPDRRLEATEVDRVNVCASQSRTSFGTASASTRPSSSSSSSSSAENATLDTIAIIVTVNARRNTFNVVLACNYDSTSIRRPFDGRSTEVIKVTVTYRIGAR